MQSMWMYTAHLRLVLGIEFHGIHVTQWTFEAVGKLQPALISTVNYRHVTVHTNADSIVKVVRLVRKVELRVDVM